MLRYYRKYTLAQLADAIDIQRSHFGDDQELTVIARRKFLFVWRRKEAS
jgi:hypothetical protein